MKRHYYTNGINECRLLDTEPIPVGYKPGRIHSTATTLNTIKINNGIEEKHWPKDQEIPEGWARGRIERTKDWVQKQSKTLRDKNYHHYTNGVNELFLCETDEIPKEYILGRLEVSKETRAKQSNSHIGLHHTQATKEKISRNSNNNRPKAIQTNLEKRGIEYVMQDPEVLKKAEETRRKNNSFNESDDEDEYYFILCEIFGAVDVKREYKDKIRYPFKCDFYIRSLDLFIELNLHWTHGGHPYDPNNEVDQAKIQEWKEKGKQSQFYRNAIKTWTKRDVLKQETARKNHLNYQAIY